MPGSRRLLLLLPLLAGFHHARAAEGMVNLRIVDETDPAEVEETTSVFINGELAATFRLDATHPSIERTIAVPVADTYDYALCGRITVRKADGHTETHVLDDGATLAKVDGMRFEALAAQDFTTFYLSELRDGTRGPPPDLHKTHVCSIPVS